MGARILLFVSVIPVILLGKYFIDKDRNKEPRELLTKLFFGGVASVIFALIITLLLEFIFPFLANDAENLNMFELFIYVFFGIALVEEVSKWIFVYKISFNHQEFDEIYDMVLYAVFVSLGFACIENILYVFNGGITVGLVRGILAVPGHCVDAVFMGHYLGKAKTCEIANNAIGKKKNIMLSILIPTIMHGIYDFCLFAGTWVTISIFVLFVIISYILAIKKIKEYANKEEKMRYKHNFCAKCGAKVESNFCPFCGHKNI